MQWRQGPCDKVEPDKVVEAVARDVADRAEAVVRVAVAARARAVVRVVVAVRARAVEGSAAEAAAWDRPVVSPAVSLEIPVAAPSRPQPVSVSVPNVVRPCPIRRVRRARTSAVRPAGRPWSGNKATKEDRYATR